MPAYHPKLLATRPLVGLIEYVARVYRDEPAPLPYTTRKTRVADMKPGMLYSPYAMIVSIVQQKGTWSDWYIVTLDDGKSIPVIGCKVVDEHVPL